MSKNIQIQTKFFQPQEVVVRQHAPDLPSADPCSNLSNV